VLRFAFYLALIAAIIYAVFWVLDRRASPGPRRPLGPGHTPPPRGPVGPDDDPDFLAQLERRRRHDNNGDQPPAT
jgi:hypothetical protein